MWQMLLKAAISGAIIVAVSEIGNRVPRLGALLLTLPLVSILAFILTWTQHRDLTAISRLAHETLILVPLGLPFFIPLGFANRLGLGFWPAFAAGILLAAATIGLWFWLGPKAI
ncbi:MAG: hypothetical protein K8T25_23550 [Planctomycetia bacterium]|nr:hypothetical protein [Planctomycetia bacterium]